MKRRRLLVAMVLLGIVCSFSFGVLIIHVTGADPQKGNIYATLATSPTEYQDVMKHQPPVHKNVLAPKPLIDWVIKNLSTGNVVVVLFQDENGNGKLDSNFLGIPIEKYAFSRQARGLVGPPNFEAAMVWVTANSQVTVNLQ